MWKKVLYVSVAFIFGVIIFFVAFMSNQVNHIQDLVGNAIMEERYPDAVRVLYGGYFDTKSIVEDDSEELELKIYPATTIVDVSYGKDDSKKKYTRCDNAYSINVFNPRYSTGVISNSQMQKTGLKFSSQDYSYDFYYVANETYNSSSYVAEPANLSEAVLNQERNFIFFEESRNLTMMCLIFSETQIKEITNILKGQAIESLSVLDNEGETVYTINVSFNFEEQYFKDMNGFVTTYNEYFDDFNATEDNDKKNEIAQSFQDYCSKWESETFSKYMSEKGYTRGASSQETSPGSLVWKTIGIEALYLLVIALFYILLFHFDKIRRIFSKDTYKNYGSKNNNGTYINGKLVKSKDTHNNNKPASQPKRISANTEHVENKPSQSNTVEVENSSETDKVIQPKETVEPGVVEEKTGKIEASNDIEEIVESKVSAEAQEVIDEEVKKSQED